MVLTELIQQREDFYQKELKKEARKELRKEEKRKERQASLKMEMKALKEEFAKLKEALLK